jgi:predicted alpha/beta-fold hydrolase
MQRRGIKSNKLRTIKCLCGDMVPDFEASVNFINKEFDNPDIFCVGLSMGAGLLTRYVGL